MNLNKRLRFKRCALVLPVTNLLTLNFKIMAELNSSSASAGGRRGAKRMPLRVDLTAMVDLAFLLITFFMLTTVLTKPQVLPVAMPADAAPGPVPETGTMTVCLGKNNQAIWYMGMSNNPLTAPKQANYGKDLSSAIAGEVAEVFKRTGKGLFVIIKPSNHSVYNNLVETIDELNSANVPSYAIAKIAPEDLGILKNKGIY